MDIAMQVKLLRVLDGYGYNLLGGSKLYTPNVRFVFATNRDLGRMKKEGKFKRDFYDRISIVKIRIPPLRARKEDIKHLVAFFKKSLSFKKKYLPSAIEFLETLDWEGNVRQLQNLLKRIDVLCEASEIGARDIDNELILDDDIIPPNKVEKKSTKRYSTLKEIEREHIEKVLNSTRNQAVGRIKTVAKILGTSPQTVHNKITEYGLKREL